MKIKRTWILPVVLVISIISLSLYAYNQIMVKTTFGKTEIKNRVESLFNGKVQSVTKTNAKYEVTFSKNDFLYKVSVDETEGTFSNITLIEEGTKIDESDKETPIAEDTNHKESEESEKETPVKEETPKEQPTKEKTEMVKPLTKQEVMEIARSKFSGEVDEIEYVGTNDGGYYNVDMENDEDEATLQIHALTGEILTITYED